MIEALGCAVTKSPYRLLPKEITNHMNVNKTYKSARKISGFFIPIMSAQWLSSVYLSAKGLYDFAAVNAFTTATTYLLGKDYLKSMKLYQPAYREIVDRALNIKKIRNNA